MATKCAIFGTPCIHIIFVRGQKREEERVCGNRVSCCQRERTCSRREGLVVVVRLPALRSPLTEDESERSRKSALRGEILGGNSGFLVGTAVTLLSYTKA